MTLITLNYSKRDKQLNLIKQSDYCFKCAVCSSVCPVTLFSEEYAVRKENLYDLTYVYHLFLATDKKRAEIAWKCSICHQCIDVCPQDVKPGEIYSSIKEWSFHNHSAPEDIYKLMKTLINKGIIFTESKMTQRKREQLGLPPMKEQPVDELMIIAQNVGLTKLLKQHDELQEGSNL